MNLWQGIPRDRIVAVVLRLNDHLEQMGSGFLIARDLVLTARHCTWDKRHPSAPVQSLTVFRDVDGQPCEVTNTLRAGPKDLDVAVLRLKDPPWPDTWDPPIWGRVDRSHGGELSGFVTAGYPLWQLDPTDQQRNLAEFHGVTRRLEDSGSRLLVLRDPVLSDVGWDIPGSVAADDRDPTSPWGGLSGAVVFHDDRVIGVVTEHHPRQGSDSVRVVPIQRIAAAKDEDTVAVAKALGLPAPELLVLVEEPVESLVGLVDLLDKGDLPRVQDLNPYQLGATPTDFGNKDTYGDHDPYVPRSANNVDTALRSALQTGRLVLLIGPSKAGKTRTAFEAVRDRWPTARLAMPDPAALARVAAHPRVTATSDPLVLWLDDLERYLNAVDPLTPAMLAGLFARPGNTVAVATLRDYELTQLSKDTGERGRGRRQVLESATSTTFRLAPTHGAEQDAARAAYPEVDLSEHGLAEQLTGARLLLDQYRLARDSDPLLYAVIETAIDWTRVGMPRPISTSDLRRIAKETLWNNRPDLDDPDDADLDNAIRTARARPRDVGGREIGPVAFLKTMPLGDHARGYLAFSYLLASDDGQGLDSRPISEHMWKQTALIADADETLAIADSAHFRGLDTTAITVLTPQAEAGNLGAMLRLGYTLVTPSTIFENGEYKDSPHTDAVKGHEWLEAAANRGSGEAMGILGWLSANVDPIDIDAARDWWEKAADLGQPDAMTSLGSLSANANPPDLDAARDWWTKAASLGQPDAMTALGYLYQRADPPNLAAARDWWVKAADLGQPDAMAALGYLPDVPTQEP